jgi:hypothetical protein
VDRGADISALSFYPEESEKLYGALSMMEVRTGQFLHALYFDAVVELPPRPLLSSAEKQRPTN